MSDSDTKDEWAHIIEFENELYKDYRAEDIDRAGCMYLGEDIYVVKALGSCPVEYTGVVGEQCFYFRSRGQTWQMVIADSRDDCLSDTHVRADDKKYFDCVGQYSTNEGAAGFMPIEQAERIILSCVALWRSGEDIN